MKRDVKKIMIESKTIETYSDSRFEVVKALMKQAIKRDAWLKNYLSLDPQGYWTWQSKNMISGKIIDYGVSENHPSYYAVNLYDYEAYQVKHYI